MPMEEVATAMKLAGAALGHYVDLRARRASVLGLVVAGQNLKLLHGIQTDGRQLVAVISRIDVADAVERQLVLVETRAVRRNRTETGVPGGLEIPRDEHAGRHRSQRQVSATVDGDVLELLADQRVRTLAALRFKLLAFGDNFYYLLDGPDFQAQFAD